MFAGLLSNALEQIQVVEQLISVHESAMNGENAQTRRQMKLYAVSSCVTRLYAIYERFVELIISDYLDALPELLPYASLAEAFRIDYRIGISHVLSRIDNDRYDHLVHENVIRWYHEALTNASTYRIVTEALTRHDHNLRLNVVEQLLSRLQLRGLRTWLNTNDEIKTLYTERILLYEQLEAEIKTFVQVRNDAAHGTLEDLEGKYNLTRFCELIKSLIRAMSPYLYKSLLVHRVQAGKARRIGEVTEIFTRAGAFVAQLTAASDVFAGMNIHIVGANYCFGQVVKSLRVDDMEVERVVADRDCFEVGLVCAINPKKRAELYVDA